LKVIATELPGVLLLEPKVFGDARGFFLETWQAARYHEAGLPERFVQDNHSRSRRGVLRGLHYQLTQPQGKLVWVTRGRCLTWRWTSAVARRPSALGSGDPQRGTTVASCGFLKASPTASRCCPNGRCSATCAPMSM
jgi:dTDP-4-dehydrorhamnose 3,5-epimerase (EC 5.1.3.13)